MEIRYRIYNEWTKKQVEYLKSFGIFIEIGNDRFDIVKGDIYNEIEPKLSQWGVKKSVATFYDKKEINKSEFLVYISVKEDGYPQPEDVFSYINLCYNTADYCYDCGVGAIQKEPFRIKKEPKWDSKQMFELTWVQDEIFVSKKLYESYFKNLGIEAIPVLLYKNNSVIENTIQLKIPTSNTQLLLSNQPFDICKTCILKKYNPQIEGFFPPLKSKPVENNAIFKSLEYFGSGGAAYKRILIRKDVYEYLVKTKNKPLVWSVNPDSTGAGL